jgi:hypothetical protein
MLRMIGRPRPIDPSLIEDGDDISVEHKANRGIVMTLRGVVAKRVDGGSTRYLMTAEGATLLAWEPGKKNAIKVTLYGREEPEQATMFDLPTEIESIKERVA